MPARLARAPQEEVHLAQQAVHARAATVALKAAAVRGPRAEALSDTDMAAGVTVDYSLTLTGAVIGAFPLMIVFLLLGRRIVGGIMHGAVKA